MYYYFFYLIYFRLVVCLVYLFLCWFWKYKNTKVRESIVFIFKNSKQSQIFLTLIIYFNWILQYFKISIWYQMETVETSIFLVFHSFFLSSIPCPSFNYTFANFKNKNKWIFWMFSAANQIAEAEKTITNII